MTNKRRRNAPEQIIRKLDEGHLQLAAGRDLDEGYRYLETTPSTWHRWVASTAGSRPRDDSYVRRSVPNSTQTKARRTQSPASTPR